jgi:hypothetical protein
MPNLPTPIRAALGLAATAVDEARKLPETVPHVVSSVPIMAVSTAMQASLRLQQHLATLAARGDEVLSQLRGNSAEPPSWATFDDSPEDDAADPQAGKAAFDRIDYESTGFAEGGADEEEGKGRWDAVGVGGTQPEADPTSAAGTAADSSTLSSADGSADGLADTAEVTATPPSAAGPTPPAPDLGEALSSPDLPVTKAAPGEAAPSKTAPSTAESAKPAKAAKAAKAAPAKAAPAKKAQPAPATAAPAKATKRAGRKAPDHEPLEVAASKAKPSARPNPATMAAEILHAHVAASDDE